MIKYIKTNNGNEFRYKPVSINTKEYERILAAFEIGKKKNKHSLYQCYSSTYSDTKAYYETYWKNVCKELGGSLDDFYIISWSDCFFTFAFLFPDNDGKILLAYITPSHNYICAY